MIRPPRLGWGGYFAAIFLLVLIAVWIAKAMLLVLALAVICESLKALYRYAYRRFH